MTVSQRRSKIVATWGPATSSPAVIRALLAHGVDVMRFNFAHSTPSDHVKNFKMLRRLARDFDWPVGILQDLPGPKIRVGSLPPEGRLLKRYEEVVLMVAGRGRPGPHILPIRYARLAEDLKPGHSVYIADGKIRLTVTRVRGEKVHCRVITDGLVRAGNGVNLPHSHLSLRAFTPADQKLFEVGLAAGADFVGLSFVGAAADLQSARSYARRLGHSPFLIAKIERREALRNLRSVVAASDGVMVARGDLGVEIPFADIPGAQEEIVFESRRQGKPVIVATQMFESMLENPRPTRAEVTDAANAVLEGADALMLSGETSVGKYPVEAVKALDAVISEAERRRSDAHGFAPLPPRDASDVVVENACAMAEGLGAQALVALTRSGLTAARTSRQRPRKPVVTFVKDESLRRRLSLYAGVQARRALTGAGHEWLRRAMTRLRVARPGQAVVVLSAGHGAPLGHTTCVEIVQI